MFLQRTRRSLRCESVGRSLNGDGAARRTVLRGSFKGLFEPRRRRQRKILKPESQPELKVFSPVWDNFEVIDSGAGRKLERFGDVTLVRPEPQATWRPALSGECWSTADGRYVETADGKRGEWKFSRKIPPHWMMRRKGLAFRLQMAPSGHVGVFPDQASHWDWFSELVRRGGGADVLCLFGYTGLATLTAAAAGARVTHVDASRQAIKWARENQRLSNLEERPVRWIVDDALTFVAREARRGRKYDGLILDPPRFGRGPKSEIWKLEDCLPVLLQRCRDVLSARPLFALINVYNTVITRGRTRKEAARIRRLLGEMAADWASDITSGELVLTDRAGRGISSSVFARAKSQPR
jgi:23S rRNA (cytosine1962-C5)-methyltransferase